MGLIALYSAHYSKVMQVLLGTALSLNWSDGDSERLWRINSIHPICCGIDEYIDLPKEKMYGEPFDILSPNDVLF